MNPPIRRALLSVSDKSGLDTFARGLVSKGVELFSTGGTRKYLEGLGLAVRDVAEYTGFPEMMDGRVKTLHPKIHGGILCRHDHPEDMRLLKENGILTFELVVVNLYPFEATIARAGVTDEEAIENIDIGGPSLVRGAAKNHAFTTIVTAPDQYAEVLAEFLADGCTSFATRRKCAGRAYAQTGAYDTAIAAYFARETAGAAEGEKYPSRLSIGLRRVETLRYGENPHQTAALYAEAAPPSGTLVDAKKLSGKELSYNNLLDLDGALAVVRGLPLPAASVVKHNNPCGAAAAETLVEACKRALAGDPQSAFGGIIGFNRNVDAATAEVLCEPGLFIEAIAAPSFDPGAFELLTTKPKWKANVRLLATGPFAAAAEWTEYRRIAGGMLVQTADSLPDPEAEWKIVTKAQPTPEQLADLRFGWSVVRHVKSNAIVAAKEMMLLGAGAGQMSRVDSVQIALQKAGDRIAGAVIASDAFFPFPDSIQLLAEAGVKAVIQPGGSRNDPDVIAACDEHGLAMIFTGRRHFKH
ncbi:MAG: bifunctional phosphoribosylaminoimidazolecarboxamide formyltransferase/IMP cyclohydrolase [Planctomycetia bacterium]|nr:bifunctional phosphoribosylaminoimidazolecarboxamide formyltransferase/IMP cyclohydrolase [Planctomycetia bacterium]